MLSDFLYNICFSGISVDYYSCTDNHSRISDNKADNLDSESLARIIPWFIEERLKNTSNFKIIKSIVMPLAKPAIVVTAVMILIYVWNEYIYSVTFMTGSDNYTLAAGLYGLQANETSGSWPLFAAASLITSLPILIIFLLVQRHMVSGLSVGGVKK